ncbi:coiled-coil domain-containing protein 1-like [Eupeodes corollae]|uniref:coiled-coil domain-containing protein 1-like n=1 Tax=Eupeodes corollae TaxID=290404 RepID=UPI002493424D|nr:coiled-coil domain-containing protein 1-like [Eupeodes corollae]
MLDTGLPSLDNNAIDTDSPVKRDELQEDTLALSPTEGLNVDVDVVATLEGEDTPDLAGNTIKSEQLSELVDAENVNEEGIKLSSSSATSSSEAEEDETDGKKDDSNDEINESIVVNQSAEDAVEELEELLEKRQELQEVIAKKQMQALVDSVGEKLSMADADEERFADEVEKMVDEAQADVVADVDADEDKEDETIEEATQKPYNQEKHSLREDVSSSDEEDDNEEKESEDENERSDISKNEGLESEWGGINIVSLDDKNILTNEIDAYESVPVDLSNDIAINDIMADQGVPINEHAELIDVEKLTSAGPQDADGLAGEESSSRLEILADIK